ncbi:MAG: sulfurtransferase [Rhodocyclaceae bacterium]|nr:sulfurtransferase [Rhodocyclaceae bacterium]
MFDKLIDAETLAARLGDSNLRIFDCRHDLSNPDYGEQAYAKGHIPGAFFLHCDRDLSGPMTGKNGRHPLPDPATFAAKMRACGVSHDTQVVVYDNEACAFASRLWWMLRWLGHDKVAVLDGGLAAWRRAKLTLTTETPAFAPGDFTPRIRSQMLVEADYVLAHLHRDDMLLIDARSEERYAGRHETLDPVAGHIPGAINRFYLENLDDAAVFFKTPQELRAEFLDLLGDHEPREVVHTCGSGVTACVNQLAMEIAGLHGSKVYAGSWSEWCSDPARPIAVGDAPG